jgi:endonuclease-3
MTRQERADRVGAWLDDHYPAVPIPLDHTDPYTLLVAVILSAQTTDKKVNQVTPALFRRAPTPAALAEVPVADVQASIREVGLAPQKAKALVGMAKLLVERHGGQVPRTFEALEALPGVGHKTASVVMSQAFGEPAFPVDTHIHRLAARWGLSTGRSVEQTEKDLKKVFPKDTWNRRHLQLIQFGRDFCPALHHDLTACPICAWAATKKRIADEAAANLALRTRRPRS